MDLDMLALLGVVIFIAVFAGAIMSFFQQREITAMQKQIDALKKQLEQSNATTDNLSSPTTSLLNSKVNVHKPDSSPSNVTSSQGPSSFHTAPKGRAVEAAPLSATPTQTNKVGPTAPSSKQRAGLIGWFADIWHTDHRLKVSIKENGLLWLGGVVLAVGGIFLANYSIEAGLVSAEIRVTLGALFGIGLIIFAEFLARHRKRFSIYSPTICAALASSGVITCYAITLVAYEYYQFIPGLLAFAILSVVSFGATSLALRFGPLLALIGIAGAYIIPALVSTGESNLATLLTFVSAVSLSGIWVAQRVKRDWPWYTSLIGHFSWAAVAMTYSVQADFGVWLGFCVFSIYLFVFTHVLGWQLQLRMEKILPVRTLLMPRKEQLGVLLPVVLLHCFLLLHGSNTYFWLGTGILACVLLIPPSRHSALDSWPGLLLISALVHISWFSQTALNGEISDAFVGGYLYVQVIALGGMAYCFYMAKTRARPAFWFYLVAYPLALFGVSYAIMPLQGREVIYSVWAGELALIALTSAILTLKSRDRLQQVTFAVLANACLTLCFTMLLNAATLSFALALQVASMTLLSVKYKVTLPDWVYKVLLTLVLVRITVAPWLSGYSDERIFTVHWTAIIYPLIFVVLSVARRYNPSPRLKVWLEGALLHVVALIMTTEPSYWLTGSYPSLLASTYHEAVLLALSWCSLAVAYWYRASVAGAMAKVYRIAGGVLLFATGYLHLDLSIASNPFFFHQDTGENPALNWLALQWVVPAVVLSCFFWAPLHKRLQISVDDLRMLHGEKVLRGIATVAGVFTCLYITSVIRKVFHQGNMTMDLGVTQGELYTYSVVWLFIATATIFIAQFRRSITGVKIGFGVLFVVITKAFVIDMANLEGLYRALSFIGLGLSLVGIGWLFQKLRGDEQFEASM